MSKKKGRLGSTPRVKLPAREVLDRASKKLDSAYRCLVDVDNAEGRVGISFEQALIFARAATVTLRQLKGRPEFNHELRKLLTSFDNDPLTLLRHSMEHEGKVPPLHFVQRSEIFIERLDAATIPSGADSFVVTSEGTPAWRFTDHEGRKTDLFIETGGLKPAAHLDLDLGKGIVRSELSDITRGYLRRVEGLLALSKAAFKCSA